MLTLHGARNRCSPSQPWCTTSAARLSLSACLPAPRQGVCTLAWCTACARHVYVCTACVHGMCTACARHVCAACAATAWVCSIPPLTHNSCWDDGNPHRRIEAGCPPFSPPTPSPPSSPPHSDRQRRLGSNTSNGHYSRGKVHTACACMCACACACVACGMCMHVQHVCICALRVHVQCAVVCAYTCTYTQTHLSSCEWDMSEI